MRKMLIVPLLIVMMFTYGCDSDHSPTAPSGDPPPEGFKQTVDNFNIETARMDDVIKAFGEPQAYLWKGEVFSKGQLPQMFLMRYPYDFGEFAVWVRDDRVQELRFEGESGGYCFKGTICLGSPLQDVIDVLGEPERTVLGGPNGYEDGVLYRGIDGKKGHDYWSIPAEGIRMFFWDHEIIGLYLTNPNSIIYSHN
jgi:hypothetical protein